MRWSAYGVLGVFLALGLLLSGSQCGNSTNCPTIYSPVCGADGKTYSNQCEAQRVNASVLCQGKCPCNNASTCSADGDCPAGKSCQSGTCEGCVCGEIADPVCGKDGKDYGNPCEASCQRAEVDCKGKCPCSTAPTCKADADCKAGTSCSNGKCEACTCPGVVEPVCGKDGKDYNNSCEASCQRAEVDCKGKCPCNTASTCKADSDCPAGKSCKDSKCQDCLCPDAVDPVCGKDGKEYGNPCEASCQRAEVDCKGKCPCSTSTACKADTDCPAGKSCQSEKCETCACAEIADPVCGKDGKDYGNPCEASCQRAEVDCKGKCPCSTSTTCKADTDCKPGMICSNGKCDMCVCPGVVDPVCGKDGKDYSNDCLAKCQHVDVACKGKCPCGSTELKWYFSCGDPVCRGHTPKSDVSDCTTEKAGDTCSTKDNKCDPKDGCNRVLICADKDPTQQPGGCPQSLKKFKHAIKYLSPTQRARFYQELMQLRLATFLYRGEHKKAPRRLGFMIDDLKAYTPVDARRERVNMYNYTSMAVAAIQHQARQIKLLRKQIKQMHSQIKTMHSHMQKMKHTPKTCPPPSR